jgi:uncharacterized coiled-coil DUF342 family protein
MSRNLILSAMMAGSLFAIGCGAATDASKNAADATKKGASALKDGIKDGADKLGDAGKKIGDAAAGALGGKPKELFDELNKELEPVSKKIDELKKKAEGEKDAGAKAEAAKMVSAGETKLKEVKDTITSSFAPDKLKDLATEGGLAKVKETVMKLIGELKKAVGL